MVFFCVSLIYVSVFLFLMSARLCRTVLITANLEYILKLPRWRHQFLLPFFKIALAIQDFLWVHRNFRVVRKFLKNFVRYSIESVAHLGYMSI